MIDQRTRHPLNPLSHQVVTPSDDNLSQLSQTLGC